MELVLSGKQYHEFFSSLPIPRNPPLGISLRMYLDNLLSIREMIKGELMTVRVKKTEIEWVVYPYVFQYQTLAG